MLQFFMLTFPMMHQENIAFLKKPLGRARIETTQIGMSTLQVSISLVVTLHLRPLRSTDRAGVEPR